MATLILGKVVIELNVTPSWWQNAMMVRPEKSAELVSKVVALLWPQLRNLTEFRMTTARIIACVMVPADDTDLSTLNAKASALVNQLEQLEGASQFHRYEPRTRP